MNTREQILYTLATGGPGTAAEIASEIDAPTKTVGMALARLLERGRLEIVGVVRPPLGRPAKVFGIRTKTRG